MRHILILLMIAVISSSARANLVAHWRFDENTGAVAHDTAGNNHGTIYGAQWTSGKFGGALSFDGMDDYVIVNKKNLPSKGPYTVSMWLYSIGKPERRYVVGGHDQEACWLHYYINNNARFTIGTDDRGSGRLIIKDAQEKNFENYRVPNDQWAHFTAVFDSSGNWQKVYKDGVRVENRYRSDGYTDPGWPFSGTDTVIGRQGSSSSKYYKGKIDDVRIYDRALSEGQIRQLYQSGLSGYSGSVSVEPTFTAVGVKGGKIDLVTLPRRDTVQLTIYNSADMTLVRESRALTLKEGKNKLQFSWANTLIDPTSLEMLPKANADKIDITDLTYPPRVRNLGLWNIESSISGKVPVEITYLTSGLSWRAFYMGTLTEDEKTMRLQGYVRVTNNSGEDYENAQTRLIVGKVHILDRIAELARRQYPYGRPGEMLLRPVVTDRGAPVKAKAEMEIVAGLKAREVRQKVIKKEGLSEYFLYTIEGTETIATGWSKRLLSFDVDEVPVINLYKYEERRYGPSVVRFLSFKNDKEHKLGDTPIPGGMLKVYRGVGDEGHLSYTGQSSFKYIPVNEDVELNLGAVGNVVVEPKLMSFRTENYRFNNHRDVAGWDEIRKFNIEVRNTRDISVKVEIKRNFRTSYWNLEKSGDFDKFEEVDKDTVKFTLTLEPRSKKQFKHTLTTYHGSREQ